MKKITTIMLLLFAVSTYAQSKSELKTKSRLIIDRVAKEYKTSNRTPNEVFAEQRFAALEAANLQLSENQKAQLLEFFRNQYEPLKLATVKYEDNNKSDASKVALIKLIVANEDNFRAILDQETLKKYLDYTKTVHVKIAFSMHFFFDFTLEKWKDNLK